MLNLDIVGVCETHLKYDDVLHVNSYNWIGQNRKHLHKKAKTGSGGVGLFVKKSYYEMFDIGVLDTSFEGILWVSFKHKNSDFRFNICVAYLPPENSTRQVDKDVFFDTLITQVYEHQNSGPFLICGDFNSRCGDENDYIVGVDDLCPRDVVDFKRNSYGNTFIDFLVSVNCCILNGRNFVNNDYTCVSTKGCSVVDYCIVPYDYLHLFSNFAVIRANDLVTLAGYDLSGVDLKLISDHSLIKWNFDLSSFISVELLKKEELELSSFNKYDCKNIPTDFMNTDYIYLEINSFIEKFDMIKQEQSCVNDIFSSFCKTVEGEMNDKLTCKTVCIGGSSLTNKKHRIKKPWWNDDLNKLWVDMCKAEKTWNKFNNCSRASELKSVYVQKRKYFDREVQKCKRKYWFSMQQDLLLESKRNQQQFWKKIGKIGVAENRKSVIPMEVIDQDGNVNSNLTAVLDKWKSEYNYVDSTSVVNTVMSKMFSKYVEQWQGNLQSEKALSVAFPQDVYDSKHMCSENTSDKCSNNLTGNISVQ
ncbi:unnamed protein product [Mytilus edulis]|uniref:Endonuclease/exonuclease/phosphatase domain-containing protein n=1 Tax=Mytilus edulis TaxID=6550 RepID=A0A8S3VCW0_MYTED|nr:unnamed protein product [Mytilus edulis]